MKHISRKLEIVLHALEDVLEKAETLEKVEMESLAHHNHSPQKLALEKQQLREDIQQLSNGLSLIADSFI